VSALSFFSTCGPLISVTLLRLCPFLAFVWFPLRVPLRFVKLSDLLRWFLLDRGFTGGFHTLPLPPPRFPLTYLRNPLRACDVLVLRVRLRSIQFFFFGSNPAFSGGPTLFLAPTHQRGRWFKKSSFCGGRIVRKNNRSVLLGTHPLWSATKGFWNGPRGFCPRGSFFEVHPPPPISFFFAK